MWRAGGFHKLTLIALGVLLICGGAQSSLCQELGNNGNSPKDGAAIFQILGETPATKMDIGLGRMQEMLETVFAVNRPVMFQRGHFYHFDVSFEPLVSVIMVGFAYKSTSLKTADLVSECEDDINLALETMTSAKWPELVATQGEGKSALFCKINSMFVNRSIPQAAAQQITHPGWSVCDSVKLSINIESADGANHVFCGRYLRESGNVIHVNE